MTHYDAYKIINIDEFEALDIPSRKITVVLGTLGLKDILVTKGNYISILYDGIFLSLNLNDKNPFEFGGNAIFVDPDNNLWLGLPVA